MEKNSCSVCILTLPSDFPGTPGTPMDMSISKTSAGLTLHWSEGNIGAAPITGYVIESRPSGNLLPPFKPTVTDGVVTYSTHAFFFILVALLFI